MRRKVRVFVPPKCDIINITSRKYTYGKMYEIYRNDGKIYNIIGRSHKYNKSDKILTIRLYNGLLPLMLEIDKEYIINNTKQNALN